MFQPDETASTALLSVLRCPACRRQSWRRDDDDRSIRCESCGRAHDIRRRVLHVNVLDEHPEVGQERASVPAWRLAQIAIIGTGAQALVIWQTATLVSILFHHSNARLPEGFERALSHVIVTPRMHGIHHSVAADEVNSNWSSGLAVWDRVHGTFRLDVPQDRNLFELGEDANQAVVAPVDPAAYGIDPLTLLS